MEKEEIGVIVENTQDCKSQKYAHVFNEEGGFIGSSIDNAFCLQDTQNQIQDKHIKITFEEGCFALTPMEDCNVYYNNAFSSMEGGYGTIINLNDTVKIGDIILRFVEPKSIDEDMLKQKNILKDLQKQPQEEEEPLRPRGQVSINFNEKENIQELISTKQDYDFLEKKFDDSFLKQMPHTNTNTFDYKNVLKILDKSFKEIQSHQKNSKFNDIYEDLTLKDLEGIIAQVPLIKSIKLINLLVLSLISKELYSPIFEEMEEDMFIKYLKVAIQSNVKEEKHLFENLTIKALEKYRK
ncbi:hypothetical protein LS70_009260 [Helicobacter sp. MIT 11-5569]|uniref:hypothetical protein n=1 Tax=Helicobacter sp. MIT 11-5569 TaxID=1548151 RepID=UPI00051F8EC5|nr:hypothetical protein [Helicobacter sp. MIT 11-5569]TLD80290.1 hypothetical protein LS70_009260 [Helicobacter sp. MIT 11-5569]